jgi:polysaccharide pyruvyl transferase WcaK-like protein
MAASEILLITRVKTLNKGNQALSSAWLAMVRRAFPEAGIRVLERRPRHLAQFTLAQFAAERDPFRAFTATAERLAKLAPGPDFIGPPPEPRIELDESMPPPDRLAWIRQRLNLRGWAARAGLYVDEYRRRLAACQRARLVVVNPAGEFFPREPGPAFYHLLDAFVAHTLGRPTAIVNHTMDIDDPTLRRLIPPLYRQLGLVGFRDDKSVAAFRAMGGDLGNVLVTPDLALTTSTPAGRTRRVGTVGIAINVPEAAAYGYEARWVEAIRGLQAQGFHVVLVSNEFPTDRPFFETTSKQLGLAIEGEGLDADDYAALLGSFDFVITSRMHTAILAMVAGAPVLPVEGASFKISGLFEELGLSAAPVINPREPGWPRVLVERAVELRTGRGDLARDVASRVASIGVRISDELVPRLRAASVAAGSPLS